MPCSGSADSTVASTPARWHRRGRGGGGARCARGACLHPARPGAWWRVTTTRRGAHNGRLPLTAPSCVFATFPRSCTELSSTSPAVTQDPEPAAEQTAVADLYRRLDAARELAVTRFRQALAMPV